MKSSPPPLKFTEMCVPFILLAAPEGALDAFTVMDSTTFLPLPYSRKDIDGD